MSQRTRDLQRSGNRIEDAMMVEEDSNPVEFRGK
jgi:hypothetical protein